MAQVYYNDYESDSQGSIPTGFESNSASFTPVVSTSNAFEGSQCVQLKKELGSATGSHWFAIDTADDPGTGDYEVEGTFWFDEDTNLRAGVVFRGQDDTTNEGYTFMLRATSTFRLSYLSGTTETTKVTANISNYSTDTHYHIKAYANGTTIKGKYWADGDSEPGTWAIDTTDSTLDNTNHLVGFYFFNGSDNTNDVFHDTLTANDFTVAPTNPQIKLSGTFGAKPVKVKLSGTFVEKPMKVRVSGTFQ